MVIGNVISRVAGALPQIDATQDASKQYIKDAQKSPFIKFSIQAVSKVALAFADMLQNGGDIRAQYQYLGKQGLLTANVSPQRRH
jgi:hypothetical protein